MSGTLPVVTADRLPVENLLESIVAKFRASTLSRQDRFWSTPPREIDDPTREVLEVSFSTARLVNYLAFRTAHFPHVVSAQFQEADSAVWQPLRTVKATPDQWWANIPATERVEALQGDPVTYALADSLPVRVDVASAIAYSHPQHFGNGHWVPVSWKVKPVLAQRVRLVLVRNPAGVAPTDPRGARAPYSLGVRDFQVGYRINSFGDLPRYGDVASDSDTFASSIDLLGSRVLYSSKTLPARNVIDGFDETVWRSNPQPVNYAVINFFADTRDATGLAQVIDRFYVDPTTVGCHINLYHSDSAPETAFEASDEDILAGSGLLHSGADVNSSKFPQEAYADSIRYSTTAASLDQVQNSFLQFDPTKAWWLGLHQRAAGVAGSDYTWLTLGPTTIKQQGGNIVFATESGQSLSIPLDPQHNVGVEFSVAVEYNPAPYGTAQASIALHYRFSDRPTVTVRQGIDHRLTVVPSTVDIGGTASGLAVKALILKQDLAEASDVESFMDDPTAYTIKSDYASYDTHTTDNALLRQHPMLVTEDNVSGIVGGPADRYRDMVWTPIARDYTLKKGFLHFPPTRAKFWKFEFTGLVAEHYESFVPIRRDVKLFRSDTVEQFGRIAGFGSWNPKDGGAGVQTAIDITNVSRYSDALSLLQDFGTGSENGHSPTEVLYAADPSQQARIRELGWVWNYQPWHIGGSAPRFVTTSKHTYERVQIDHRTKMAFFVGLKALRAYRLDYKVDDDTEQYLDHFHDDDNVATSSGVVFLGNEVRSLGNYSEVVSDVFESRRAVRGLQFATEQTDAAQLLEDDLFKSNDLAEHWQPYGDASLTLDLNSREVTVNRGWFARSYGMLEGGAWGSYASMETRPYGELEGGQANGLAGGGMDSEVFSPSHSGRVYGATKITAPNGLTSPIEIQLVGADSGSVLSSVSRLLVEGETATFWTGYTVGSVSAPVTYGQVEAGATLPGDTPPVTYGDLEAEKYREIESLPIVEDVFVRVVQVGPTRDSFIIKRTSAFDSPVSWDFSVDGGLNWYDSMDIRNNPNGVLTFPGFGTELRWRMRIFRPGAYVSALAIRPWYLGDLGAASGNHGMMMLGPNRSVVDVFPAIEDDPMWKQWDQPIPRSWYNPPITTEQQGNIEPGPPVTPPAEPPRDVIIRTASDSAGSVGDSASAIVMLPGFLDQFTSAQSDPNARGLRWTYEYYGPGTYVIVGNQLSAYDLSATVPTFALVNTGRSDATIGLTFASLGGGQGFVYRFTDVSNYWVVKPNGVFKVQAGVMTQVVAWAAISAPFRYDALMIGNTVVITRDSLEMATIVDSFNATATRHGTWRTT